MKHPHTHLLKSLGGACALALCLLGATAVAAKIPDHWGARSVHVWHPGPGAEWVYGEVKVESSVPGSYFSVIGFNCGYFGIQELLDGSRVAIFSVWDPGDPFDFGAKADSVEERLRLLFCIWRFHYELHQIVHLLNL